MEVKTSRLETATICLTVGVGLLASVSAWLINHRAERVHNAKVAPMARPMPQTARPTPTPMPKPHEKWVPPEERVILKAEPVTAETFDAFMVRRGYQPTPEMATAR